MRGECGFAEGKKEHEATQVPAQYDGLRCGRVGKHGLDLSGDRRLRERQQLRQTDARVGIGAANLQPIEILIGNCAGVGVQLGDERDHARWQRLGGTSGQLSRLDCACAAPNRDLVFEQGASFGGGNAAWLAGLSCALQQTVSGGRTQRQKAYTDVRRDVQVTVLFKYWHERRQERDETAR